MKKVKEKLKKNVDPWRPVEKKTFLRKTKKNVDPWQPFWNLL